MNQNALFSSSEVQCISYLEPVLTDILTLHLNMYVFSLLGIQIHVQL
jgi:hypothetical protein